MSKKVIIAFDFDGVIIDTAYESFLISAKTFKLMTGKDVITKKNALLYSKGRAFSLNAHTNFTLIKMISENPNIDFSKISQSEFDEQTKMNLKKLDEFAEKFIATRHAMMSTKEWVDIQKPFKGVVELIDSLSKNHEVYIVTTKARDTVLALLEHNKINFPKERVITKQGVETKDILLKEVAEKENALTSQVILIDDALKQLVKAKEIGAKTILAMWGEKREVFENEAKTQNIPIAYMPKDCEKIIANIYD